MMICRYKHREQADIMALSIALTENVINNERKEYSFKEEEGEKNF